MSDMQDDFWFLIGRESELVEVVDVHAGGDGSEVLGVGVEIDVLCGHANLGHRIFFISEDALVPDYTKLDLGPGVLSEVEPVAGFEEDEALVLGAVDVGVVWADDVDDA